MQQQAASEEKKVKVVEIERRKTASVAEPFSMAEPGARGRADREAAREALNRRRCRDHEATDDDNRHLHREVHERPEAVPEFRRELLRRNAADHAAEEHDNDGASAKRNASGNQRLQKSAMRAPSRASMTK